MNCPNCGYPRAKYDKSRKEFWGGFRKESSATRKTDARTNFMAHCPKCGHKWDNKPEDYVSPEVSSEEELEETEADMDDEEE